MAVTLFLGSFAYKGDFGDTLEIWTHNDLGSKQINLFPHDRDSWKGISYFLEFFHHSILFLLFIIFYFLEAEISGEEIVFLKWEQGQNVTLAIKVWRGNKEHKTWRCPTLEDTSWGWSQPHWGGREGKKRDVWNRKFGFGVKVKYMTKYINGQSAYTCVSWHRHINTIVA